MLLSIVTWCLKLNAQVPVTRIDSLKALIEREDLSDKERIKLYNDLANSCKVRSLDSMYKYTKLALSLSEVNNDKEGLIYSYKNLATYQSMTYVAMDSVFQTFRLALKYAEEIKDIRSQAGLYNNISPVSYTHLTLPTILLV